MTFNINRHITVQIPAGDEHSAVHEELGEHGHLAGALHDPTGLLYHEAQQYYSDDGQYTHTRICNTHTHIVIT